MKNQDLKTIRELLDYAVGLPDATAVRYYDNEKKEIIDVPYSQYGREIYHFGNYYEKMRDGKEVRVALIGVGTYEYLTAAMGAVVSGNVMITLDPLLESDEICRRLNFMEADVLVYHQMFAKMVPVIQSKCPSIKSCIMIDGKKTADVTVFSDIIADTKPEINTIPDREDWCAVMFTSGTTGKGKAVMLSHKNLMHNVLTPDEQMGEGEVLLQMLPIHHAYGFSCDVLLGIAYHLVVSINDTLPHIMMNMKRYGVTVSSLVPMILKSICQGLLIAAKKNPDVPKPIIKNEAFGEKLRCFYCGGAYLDPNLKKTMREFGIVVVQGYGITECSPRISTAGWKEDFGDSCGKLLEGMELKTVEGEIWVRGDSVMMGYYGDEASTREVLTEDGWFKTGDLGYMDDDNLVYITGRKKNLIILSNGENISPEEIELLYEREPFVAEVVVYQKEDKICAEVYPNKDYVKASGIEDAEAQLKKIGATINAKLPTHKQVKSYILRDVEFPKTTSRKIIRQGYNTR